MVGKSLVTGVEWWARWGGFGLTKAGEQNRCGSAFADRCGLPRLIEPATRAPTCLPRPATAARYSGSLRCRSDGIDLRSGLDHMAIPLPEGFDTAIRVVISDEIGTTRVRREVLALEPRTKRAITRFFAKTRRSGRGARAPATLCTY